MSNKRSSTTENDRSSGVAWSHFWYIVGILVTVIIVLLADKLADNAPVVRYVSFALMLASILLAVVAIVYAITSNTSLIQSISNVVQATGEIRTSAASLSRVAGTLSSRLERVSDRVDATHKMVEAGFSSAVSRPVQRLNETGSTIDFAQFIQDSSPIGKLSVYAVAVAFDSKVDFDPFELFNVVATLEDYPWGWIMAMGAAGFLSIAWQHTANNAVWRVTFFAQALLSEIRSAAAQAPDVGGQAAENTWSKQKVEQVDEFFAKLRGARS